MDYEKLLGEAPDDVGHAWFAQIADVLLNKTVFSVKGVPHRFVEVEFYYYGGAHPDPFAHCDPLQQTLGKWYFHREGGQYRGGSFKGLDISFGPEGQYGGILIRTIQGPEGEVNGCSLCVDHLLSQTGHASVAELDADVAERSVWDESCPLHLTFDGSLSSNDVLPTARVGLTLKRMKQHPEMPMYIMRDYRFLTDPLIKKGKVHAVIALHKQGIEAKDIQAQTRSPAKSIRGYVQSFEDGTSLQDFSSFQGKALKTADLCRLHGAWHAHYG